MKPSPFPTVLLSSPSHWCEDSFQFGLHRTMWFIQSQKGNSFASFLEEVAVQDPGCSAQGCGTLEWHLAKGPQSVANWKSVTWLCSLTSPYSSLYLWHCFTQLQDSEGLLPLVFLPCISCNYIPEMHSEDGSSLIHVLHSMGYWTRNLNKTRKLFSPLGSVSKLAIVLPESGDPLPACCPGSCCLEQGIEQDTKIQ